VWRRQTRVSHKDGTFKVEYGDDHKTDTIEVEQLLVATGVKVCAEVVQCTQDALAHAY
jgi:pyruvate/2-oxoglutarate dehydrogenase complex dihydrolipoamide dehydrogenase (E3) component